MSFFNHWVIFSCLAETYMVEIDCGLLLTISSSKIFTIKFAIS